MALRSYRYRSRRSVRKLARRSRRNFIITLVLIVILIYATISWVLPNFIGGIGFIKNILTPPKKITTQPSETGTLAPPVLSIPYEATNTAQIDIKGFGTPNSKVKLYLDDDPKETVDVAGDGSFTFEGVTLTLGTNNIYGKTLDDKDRESLPSKTIKIIYNNEKPSLTINEPEDNKKIQGGDKKVRVAGKTDPGVKIYINGTQGIVNSDGNFGIDQPLSDGDNIISVKAVNPATNYTEVQRKVIFQPQNSQETQ